MDFTLTEEQRMVQRTVREFIEKEVMPYETQVLRNEREGRPGLPREELLALRQKAKDLGFWGINTPEEYGGANLGPIMSALIAMETARTFVPFSFGGSADNILYYCNEEKIFNPYDQRRTPFLLCDNGTRRRFRRQKHSHERCERRRPLCA
jgi:acyl-CoA dehydrogenase